MALIIIFDRVVGIDHLVVLKILDFTVNKLV